MGKKLNLCRELKVLASNLAYKPFVVSGSFCFSTSRLPNIIRAGDENSNKRKSPYSTQVLKNKMRNYSVRGYQLSTRVYSNALHPKITFVMRYSFGVHVEIARWRVLVRSVLSSGTGHCLSQKC